MIELQMSCKDVRVITDIMQNSLLDRMIEWTSTTSFQVDGPELAEEILETILEFDSKLEIEII